MSVCSEYVLVRAIGEKISNGIVVKRRTELVISKQNIMARAEQIHRKF